MGSKRLGLRAAASSLRSEAPGTPQGPSIEANAMFGLFWFNTALVACHDPLALQKSFGCAEPDTLTQF
jgi:hypothetical protein